MIACKCHYEGQKAAADPDENIFINILPLLHF